MKRYIKSSSYYRLLVDEVEKPVSDAIYHFENNLGSDYDEEDIVWFVEKRVLGEEESYPISAKLVKDPIDYLLFSDAVIKELNRQTRS